MFFFLQALAATTSNKEENSHEKHRLDHFNFPIDDLVEYIVVTLKLGFWLIIHNYIYKKQGKRKCSLFLFFFFIKDKRGRQDGRKGRGIQSLL